MNFKCCENLIHEIVFAQAEVIPCCCSPHHEYNTRFISNFNDDKFNIQEYINQRKKYIEMFKRGEIPSSCRDCQKIQEKDWDETCKINRIIISNRTKCSCNCIYCSLVTTSNQTKEELNTRKAYNIVPVLKDMHSNNIINNNCLITVAGGECCEYPQGELENIIYIAVVNNCRLEILSSGIIYSQTIENSLRIGQTTLKISVDSGYKSTYEKIKRVKAYDKIWNNLKKYIEASKTNNSSSVIIKYIIIPSINDNKKEVEKFISKCKGIDCKKIEIAIEYLYFEKHNNQAAEKKIIETVNYLKASNLEYSFEMNEFEEWIEKS